MELPKSTMNQNPTIEFSAFMTCNFTYWPFPCKFLNMSSYFHCDDDHVRSPYDVRKHDHHSKSMLIKQAKLAEAVDMKRRSEIHDQRILARAERKAPSEMNFAMEAAVEAAMKSAMKSAMKAEAEDEARIEAEIEAAMKVEAEMKVEDATKADPETDDEAAMKVESVMKVEDDDAMKADSETDDETAMKVKAEKKAAVKAAVKYAKKSTKKAVKKAVKKDATKPLRCIAVAPHTQSDDETPEGGPLYFDTLRKSVDEIYVERCDDDCGVYDEWMDGDLVVAAFFLCDACMVDALTIRGFRVANARLMHGYRHIMRFSHSMSVPLPDTRVDLFDQDDPFGVP